MRDRNDLIPPLHGLASDPVLFGVSRGLRMLFEPVHGPTEPVWTGRIDEESGEEFRDREGDETP